jgi:hypothetical protein
VTLPDAGARLYAELSCRELRNFGVQSEVFACFFNVGLALVEGVVISVEAECKPSESNDITECVRLSAEPLPDGRDRGGTRGVIDGMRELLLTSISGRVSVVATARLLAVEMAAAMLVAAVEALDRLMGSSLSHMIARGA